MERISIKLMCFFFLVGNGYLFSQNSELQSGELWSGATFKVEYNKKWMFQLEEQLRLWNDLGSVKSSFTEIGAGCEPFSDFEIVGRYRFTIVPNSFAEDAIEKSAFNRSRFMLDIKYELDKKGFPLSLEYRMRMQDSKELYTGHKRTFLRNRIGLEWEATDDIKPYLEYESFYRFNSKNEFRGNRYSFGIDWRINKKMDLSTFYRVDQQINTRVNDRQNIVGISYTYEIEIEK